MFKNLFNINFNDIKAGDVLYLLDCNSNEKCIKVSRVIKKNNTKIQAVDAKNKLYDLCEKDFNITYFFNRDIAYYMSYT